MNKRTGMLYLSGHIDEDSCSFLAQALNVCTAKTITLHIHSAGGEDDSGFAMYDLIRLCPKPTTAWVVGVCESAAVLPFLACDRRMMSGNSVIQIHHGTVGMGRQHQREAITNALEISRRDDLYMALVAERTGNSLRQVKEWAKFGHFFSAVEALEHKFVHSVVSDKKLTLPKPPPAKKRK